eukprot:8889010-Alexandrium_andersonii.AAC.1
MSASLVGSEMCIRDSLTSTICNGIRRRSALVNVSMGSSLVGPMGRGAVSYTHLTLPTICSV